MPNTIASITTAWLKKYVAAHGLKVRVVGLGGAPVYVVKTGAEATELRHQGFSPIWTERTLVKRVSTPLS